MGGIVSDNLKKGHNDFLHTCTKAPSDDYGNVGFYMDNGSEVEGWYAGEAYERIYEINYCPWCGECLTQ
jgi:hypothetical protein